MYYLLLGSNLGDRPAQLSMAKQRIQQEIGPVALASSIYETEPWGFQDQASFLNMALAVDSNLNPEKVLEICRLIEKAAGEKPDIQWGPRHLDIDILYHDQDVLKTQELTIPHPRIQERNFVLVPLMEIAGEFTDPLTNLTIEEMYDQCTDLSEVFLYEGDAMN
ncbi:MAG: 2-amino-4-hydroxy-6-hydroxymethyldihydropteridine diphosphokinase [Saprospiraceae bacterium]|jgi:2-amino-4-hydroxy-6-hydroxymethyldihydropteridine diphosphokinase|nr:2-amino-4-hydroxy-6-hydroxymethyldihydropteridine diphosphokinase [Saprospiraceae bacterium]